MTRNEKTFVKITNKEIYKELQEIHKKVIKLNGLKKLVMGSYAFSLIILGWLVSHLLGG